MSISATPTLPSFSPVVSVQPKKESRCLCTILGKVPIGKKEGKHPFLRSRKVFIPLPAAAAVLVVGLFEQKNRHISGVSTYVLSGGECSWDIFSS